MNDTTAQDQLHLEIAALKEERTALLATIEKQNIELVKADYAYERLLSHYESATA